MALSRDYAAFIEDILSPLGPVSVRSMFGGGGVYLDGVMFGLIAEDTLFFKVDETTVPAFETEGMQPFGYDGRSGRVVMPYRQVPERLLEETDELVDWARRALDVARRGKRPAAAKRPRQR